MTRLVSFDGTEGADGALLRPERDAALRAALAEPSWIARGAGLSYCGAGLGPRTIDGAAFDRVLGFDAADGTITVEAGTTLGAIYRAAAPSGWHLSVMPGHPSITVGGCVAANVHGKNQHAEGCFSSVVEGFTLFHPERGALRCSRTENAGAFWLTLGGFGLTGFLLDVTLRLKRIPAETLILERIPVRSFVDAVAVMKTRASAASLYSWHQPCGRGFVFAADPAPGRPGPAPRWRALTGGHGGPQLLNRLTAPLALTAYELGERLSAAKRTVTLAEALFPVAGREFYFSLFGKKGFREYQLLVPEAAFASFCKELDALRRRHGAALTLASLKLFSGKQRFLNFDGTGIALAIDAPEGPATRALWDALDPVVAAHGGTVNAAKDSRLTAAAARKLFPGYEAFASELAAWDPRRVVDSLLRRRLEL